MSTTYYIAELQNRNSYREAEKTDVETLKEAKRMALREQVFQGTVMAIGTAVDSRGFILEPVAVHENGKWID